MRAFVLRPQTLEPHRKSQDREDRSTNSPRQSQRVKPDPFYRRLQPQERSQLSLQPTTHHLHARYHLGKPNRRRKDNADSLRRHLVEVREHFRLADEVLFREPEEVQQQLVPQSFLRPEHQHRQDPERPLRPGQHDCHSTLVQEMIITVSIKFKNRWPTPTAPDP